MKMKLIKRESKANPKCRPNPKQKLKGYQNPKFLKTVSIGYAELEPEPEPEPEPETKPKQKRAAKNKFAHSPQLLNSRPKNESSSQPRFGKEPREAPHAPIQTPLPARVSRAKEREQLYHSLASNYIFAISLII